MVEEVDKRSYRENVLVLNFGALFLLSLIMIFNQGLKTTGYATQVSTTSNVTITTYFSIALSQNLSNGIEFGSIASLPAINQNATHNDDGLNTTPNGTGTSFWSNVSTDSNTAVDFCLTADELNTSANDIIGLGNETYHNATVTNVSLPYLPSEVSLTTSFVKAGNAISVGSSNYYRFWLDVPAGTAAGTYNNTVSFKGVATGGSC